MISTDILVLRNIGILSDLDVANDRSDLVKGDVVVRLHQCKPFPVTHLL